MPSPERCVAVIPCLNEAATISTLVTEALRYLPAVLVVDDGSSDGTGDAAQAAGATVIRRTNAGGKGLALAEGFRLSRALGYGWAVALDGDGQHAPSEIPAFMAAARGTGARMIVGNRMAAPAAMPWLRRWVNRWMSATLSDYAGQDWPDSQCGFRLVNLDSWAQADCQAEHFEIESELLVRFAAAGHNIQFVPITTHYGGEQSKIRPLRDTWRWLKWWWAIRRELDHENGGRLDLAPSAAPTNG